MSAMPTDPYAAPMPGMAHGNMTTVGLVDHERNGFDPTAMLTDWETGRTELLPDGRTLRTFEVDAIDREIEIAPGIFFPAWTFNGRVPGPALRAKEGERLRIIFRNLGSHPHSMHFHGIHSARMDGVPGAGLIGPGEEFVYEFDAKPFGCHLYHCHALPLKRHMHKGMYGLFMIDPDTARLMGINVDRIIVVAFAVGATLAADGSHYLVRGRKVWTSCARSLSGRAAFGTGCGD